MTNETSYRTLSYFAPPLPSWADPAVAEIAYSVLENEMVRRKTTKDGMVIYESSSFPLTENVVATEDSIPTIEWFLVDCHEVAP